MNHVWELDPRISTPGTKSMESTLGWTRRLLPVRKIAVLTMKLALVTERRETAHHFHHPPLDPSHRNPFAQVLHGDDYLIGALLSWALGSGATSKLVLPARITGLTKNVGSWLRRPVACKPQPTLLSFARCLLAVFSARLLDGKANASAESQSR